MAGSIRKRRDISSIEGAADTPSFADTNLNEPTSDLEVFAKEVLSSLINDNLPPTPNNFALYFDRILEEKSESLRKQITTVLEFDEDNDDEKTINLEKNLKQSFSSVKNILQVSANLYKNMALMTKILDKRKNELGKTSDSQMAVNVITSLEQDVNKLNTILKKQIDQIKTHYDTTATLVKNVENETIFDNQFGVYNKRYLLGKLEQECNLINEFKHNSTLIMIELSKSLEKDMDNDKAVLLMTRTIARLLLKTSRRSDIVAHFGNGVFAMVLKHTNVQSAEKASERLCDLVSSSNFFLAEREIQLKISIGIKDIDPEISIEETIVATLDAMDEADRDRNKDYVISETKQLEDESDA